MAAAATLAERGVAVTVFEAGKVLGGRARRVERNGFALDNGLHILVGAYRETQRLMALVGAPPAFLRAPLEWEIAGRFSLRVPRLPAPLHAAWALISARGITVAARLKAARFMRALRRRDFRLDRDITVAALLDRYDQDAALRRYLWHPLCVAALNTPPAQASAQVFLNVLRDGFAADRAASDVLLARTDLSQLFPEPAAAFVSARGGQVRLGETIAAIEPAADGLRLVTSGRSYEFSHAICAVPPHRAGVLLAGLPELAPARAMIERFEYQPIYSVYLKYPRTPRLAVPMLGLDGGYSQWLFDRARICGQQGLVAAVISAEGGHEALSHDALAQRVHTELAVSLPGLPAPEWHFVVAEKRATFACTPALERPGQATPLPNLHLAGDYTAGDYPATIESAVRSGVVCARRILAPH